MKVYEETVKAGYPTLEIYEKLANTQYFRSNYQEAKKWFEMEMPNDETKINRYRQNLKALKVSVEKNKYLKAVKVAGH